MEEVTLIEIGQIIFKRKWLVIVLGILFALTAFLLSTYLFVPTYQATTSLFVNNGADRTADSVTSISDITASQELVGTYIQILNSNSVLNEVLERTGLDYTADELREMVSMSALNNTEVLEINVVSADAAEATLIANTLLTVAPDMLVRIVQAASVETIDTAVGAERVGPNVEINTIIGVLLGVILGVLIAITVAILDKRIKGENDLTQYQLPILATVPDSHSLPKKGGYYHEKT